MSHNRPNTVVRRDIKKIRKIGTSWMKILKHNQRWLYMPYIVCTNNFNGVQNFIFFLNPWRVSAFLIFSGRISHSFVPSFETVSLPYEHDLIICLSMQLFFLKSYEWSLNLKISVIISGANLLFTLHISVHSTWIFLSWIVAELSFSWSSRKEELLSL